jgi:phosphatidylglycerol:prolipoprotein diacylglycerol transferase
LKPTLFEIPAWDVVLPLAPLALCAALVAAVLAWAARHRQRRSLALACGGLGLILASGAWLLRGKGYAPGSLPVHSYGVFLCAALVAGFRLTLRHAERAGMSRDFAGNCYVIAAFAGLVGARLLYVLENSSGLGLDALEVRQGGFVAYGGFLGGALGAAWYCRRHRMLLRRFADAAAPALALGLCWTRLGCYAFGCDFGVPLGPNAPDWVRRLGSFPRWVEGPLAHRGSPAWHQHVEQGVLSPFAETSMPVHPTQLYEAAAGAALLALVLALWKKRRFHGQVFAALAVSYAALRFVIEALRGDVERGHFGPALPTALFVPVLVCVVAAAWAWGPARSSGALRWWVAIAFGAVGVIGARLAPAATALSTSQCLALLTAAFAVWVQYRILETPAPPAPSRSG